MLAAGTNSGPYKLVLVLHLLASIVGFGAVMLNALYVRQAQRRPGPDGLAVLEANFAVSSVAEKVIYAVPVLGLALVGMSDKAWKFSQLWVWLSLVLFVVALGIVHAIVIPSEKKVMALLRRQIDGDADPSIASELEANGKKRDIAGPILAILLVVIVFLMVWKPGV
ncbi:MAG: hypothetical protein JWL73_2280 [Actinomycetia bacterium]|nr:hypothetical protein [Actinomycetes bacterium]